MAYIIQSNQQPENDSATDREAIAKGVELQVEAILEYQQRVEDLKRELAHAERKLMLAQEELCKNENIPHEQTILVPLDGGVVAVYVEYDWFESQIPCTVQRLKTIQEVLEVR